MKLINSVTDVVEMAVHKAITVETAVSQLYVIFILDKYKNHIKSKNMSTDNNSWYIQMHNKILNNLNGDDFADIDGERSALSEVSETMIDPPENTGMDMSNDKPTKCKSFAEFLKELPWRIDY